MQEEGASRPDGAGKFRLPTFVVAAISPLLLTLQEQIRSYLIANPVRALIIAGIWLLSMFLLTFVIDVWAELRRKLVRQTADSVGVWIGNCFQRHGRDYTPLRRRSTS
jgi:hypothetical protein